ncbi:MAG: O-antigen biosynthesis protein WlbD [Methylomicrobium sp.]
MKITTIIGARPQFIKAAALSRCIKSHNDLTETLVHTGQHFDANMSEVFFKELDIPKPDFNLGIGGGTHGQNTGRMIEAIEQVLMQAKPDWVLVYGDTDSTLAGTLAAVKLHIPVAHVEAGLRSFNRQMPEEINRVLTDHAADLLFAPTETAVAHLRQEGITPEKIAQVGDVMFDAALYFGAKAEKQSRILDTLGIDSKNYVLATLHRQENTDDKQRLAAILHGLATSPWPVILPLHPRTRNRLTDYGLSVPDPITITAPVGYLDMVMLEKNACLIATDSGGVQKEAFFHRVPCITLREETEWVELVEIGVNRLVGYSTPAIEQAITSPPSFPDIVPEFYGSGGAAQHILAILMNG